MKIAFLTRYFGPEIGAAPELVSQLCEDMVHHGHQVTVVAPHPSYNVPGGTARPNGKFARWEQWKGVRIRRVWMPRHRANLLGKGLEHLVVAPSLFAGALGLPRHDVVFGISPPLATGLACDAIARIWQTQFVFNVQDIFPQNAIDLGVLQNRALIRFFEAMERYLYRRAGRITVHSAGNLKLLIERGCPPDRVVEVPNWVDTRWVAPQPADNEFRRTHAPNAQFLVVFAGTMGFSQDLDVVLRCVARLAARAEIQFLLVGDGPERSRLEARASEMQLENLRFVPMQPPEKYPRVLAASDACLVTLHNSVRTPVVPSKILTIMAASRPVIAALPAEGDAPALIKLARAGTVVEAGDDHALAQAIVALVEDPGRAAELGRNGRAYAETYLAREVIAHRWENLFQEVAQPLCPERAVTNSWREKLWPVSKPR